MGEKAADMNTFGNHSRCVLEKLTGARCEAGAGLSSLVATTTQTYSSIEQR